jgi:hypothetical protein
MGTKSIREIVESALVAHLAAQTELTGVNVEKGIETDVMSLPTVVVSCESVASPGDLPEGLGNYACTVQIGVFTSADATNAKSDHRDRCAAVLGALQAVSTIKGVFTTQGDATCYDVTYQSHDDSRGDRALGMMATFTVDAVLPA